MGIILILSSGRIKSWEPESNRRKPTYEIGVELQRPSHDGTPRTGLEPVISRVTTGCPLQLDQRGSKSLGWRDAVEIGASTA